MLRRAIDGINYLMQTQGYKMANLVWLQSKNKLPEELLNLPYLVD